MEVLPFPPEVYDKISPIMKTSYSIRELPAGYFEALEKKQYVVGLPSIVVCRTDFPEELAYTLLKLDTEKVKKIRRIHPLFREHGRPEYQLTDDFPIPFHPGAIRYFKEAKMWTPAHEARQKHLSEELEKRVRSSK
jgi:TRAP-type uncharacterized transport system substrate-binding protein